MVAWREATANDRERMAEWLLANQRGPVFALSNLMHDGMIAAGDDGPHTMRFWIGGDWAGMVGLERGGMLLPQIGALTELSGLRNTMQGVRVAGVIGDAAQIPPVLHALGLDRATPHNRMTQISYALALADLDMPDCTGLRLEPFRPDDAALLARWFTDYDLELGLNSADQAARTAPTRVEDYQRADSHRVLWRGNQRVAMTGFNARLPGLVQVGGVYCPPNLRGQGFARAAVALHLAETARQGTRRAFLFAVSDIAARAYAAIGFVPEGKISLTLFDPPEVIA